jgi:hypothetical protein
MAELADMVGFIAVYVQKKTAGDRGFLFAHASLLFCAAAAKSQSAKCHAQQRQLARFRNRRGEGLVGISQEQTRTARQALSAAGGPRQD